MTLDEVIHNFSIDELEFDLGATFVIDAKNLKIIGHAVHTLSKFSDQLCLEPARDGLSMKAVNSSISAYGSTTFLHGFFTTSDVVHIDHDKYNTVRISMKSALSVFKTNTPAVHLSCQIQIDPDADMLIVKINQAYQLMKCNVIALRECVAQYKNLFNDKAGLANCITIHAQTLLKVLPQIGSDLDYLRLIAQSNKLTIERYVDDAHERMNSRKTYAVIDLDALESYIIPVPTEIAINLKEFRAVLAFAAACGMSVNIHFDKPGQAAIIAVERNIDFVAEFTISTMGEDSHFDEQNEPMADQVHVQQQPQRIADGESTRQLHDVPDSRMLSDDEDNAEDEVISQQHIEEIRMEDGPMRSITAASVMQDAVPQQEMRDDLEYDYESQYHVPRAGAVRFPDEYPMDPAEQDVPRKILALSQATKFSTQSMLERSVYNYCSDDDDGENLL